MALYIDPASLPVAIPPGEWKPFFRRKIATAFRMIDRSGTGVLKREKSDEWSEKLSVHVDEEHKKSHSNKHKEKLDAYAFFGKDSITESEYIDEWMKLAFSDEENRRKHMVELTTFVPEHFDPVDKNGDGFIDIQEFHDHFLTFDAYPTNLRVVFDAVDTDKNGVISREEYTRAVLWFWFNSGPDDPISLLFGRVDDTAMTSCVKLPVNPPPEEWREFFRRKFMTLFRTLDRHGTGVIKREDVKLWAERSSVHKEDEEARQKEVLRNMEDFDKYTFFGRESQITEKEYTDEMMKIAYGDRETRKKHMMEFIEMCPHYFDPVDTNGDGSIDPEEFKAIFNLFGVESSETCKAVFDAIDTDKNGVISRDEHTNALIQYCFQSGPEDPVSMFFGKVVALE